ncbi:MAG: phosphoenolpyruvate carboxykinase domain-containing protein, partial [Promethearchaeota archaeon]
GIFYGGRDSNTMPPVLESLNWEHGVFLGASIESETTAQTLGAEGIRKTQPMANLDFIVVPLGRYFKNHQIFGNCLSNPPKVFAMNYFLKNKDGKFLNGKLDKLCWVIWAEGRIHGEFEAIKTPIGYIPKYDILEGLFKQYLNKEYNIEEYIEQFTIRTTQLTEKLDRITQMYEKEKEMPQFIWELIQQQRIEIIEARKKYNKNEISPTELAH